MTKSVKRVIKDKPLKETIVTKSLKQVIKDKQWRLLYANIRGIKSKMACLKNVCEEVEPDVILLTETHLSEDKGVNLIGYTFIGKARKTAKGGGVAIFVKNDKKSIVAPHYTHRDIELLWISIHRRLNTPVFIGVYYGKQESTCSVQKITDEMDLLSEELLEKKQEGEMILCMDANAKIGLLGESVSRNGKLISNVFDECEMVVINGTDKCDGQITRQNRKNKEERSAIDFVTATQDASDWIARMKIDEDGDLRMKNKAESDHNTILLDLQIPDTAAHKSAKLTTWNIKASTEKYNQFREKLRRAVKEATKVMKNRDVPMAQRYARWEKLLYQSLISTIGKTTIKLKSSVPPSKELKRLRRQRKELKVQFEREKNPSVKKAKMLLYIQKQHEIKDKAEEEEEKRFHSRFAKMKEDRSKKTFWTERGMMKKDQSSSWLITKDSDGKRIFDPEMNKENVANFYESLYKENTVAHHPYHDTVKTETQRLKSESNTTEDDYLPTKAEVKQAIMNKKNRKASTDWKTEIIKGGGDEFVNFVYPVIKAFWEEEVPPSKWNQGLITSVWKGKGDRECMNNQRGITVSSAIGTIAEELVYNRIMAKVNFTQAQAGGKKGASTADHVFVLRNVIALAKDQKRNIIITFFDVKKAYDKVDPNDMLYCMHKSNVNGKTWRLMSSLNTGLTAKINTKVGLTREIAREAGGKQGGKIMVPLFAKMMDTAAEDMQADPNLGISIANITIQALIFVDDKITFAEGDKQQQLTLKFADTFAQKHKLEWGKDKCKTMTIGYSKNETKEWKLGGEKIGACQEYKYLGDIISQDGKNTTNLKERKNKVNVGVRSIVTCCNSGVMKKMATQIASYLYETEIIPALLYNCETWNLSNAEKKFLDQIELQAWKKLIGLPNTTPSAGIMHTIGSLFPSIRVEQKQLIYLQKVLQRNNEHWTKATLMAMNDKKVGWAKQINSILEKWGLEPEWENIKNKRKKEWTQLVNEAAEKINVSKLNEECDTKNRNETKTKTKVAHLKEQLNSPNYVRKRDPFIMRNQSMIHARALIMGRFGMLQCAKNFATQHGTKQCKDCGVIDDESHRINFCTKYRTVNNCDKTDKIEFDDIYSDDNNKIMNVVKAILCVWDLAHNKNEMRF